MGQRVYSLTCIRNATSPFSVHHLSHECVKCGDMDLRPLPPSPPSPAPVRLTPPPPFTPPPQLHSSITPIPRSQLKDWKLPTCPKRLSRRGRIFLVACLGFKLSISRFRVQCLNRSATLPPSNIKCTGDQLAPINFHFTTFLVLHAVQLIFSSSP